MPRHAAGPTLTQLLATYGEACDALHDATRALAAARRDYARREGMLLAALADGHGSGPEDTALLAALADGHGSGPEDTALLAASRAATEARIAERSACLAVRKSRAALLARRPDLIRYVTPNTDPRRP